MSKEIVLANPRGFCAGVDRAIEIVEKALKIYGPVYGFWLAIIRISKCHPWGGYGYDPIPDKEKK